MADYADRHGAQHHAAWRTSKRQRQAWTPVALPALLIFSLCAAAGCSEPSTTGSTTGSGDALSDDSDAGEIKEIDKDALENWQVLEDNWFDGALASAWCDKSGDKWVLVGGGSNSYSIVEMVGSKWVKRGGQGTDQLWWVHGDESGRRIAVGNSGVILSWVAGTQQLTLTRLPRPGLEPVKTALYGVWFSEKSEDVWIVGGDPAVGPGSGVVFKIAKSALQAGELKESQIEYAKLDDKLGVMFKVIGTDDGQLWVVGDGGQIWHRKDEKWELEATINTDVLIGIAGDSPTTLVTVGGRGSGVVARRGADGWSTVAGGSSDSWISGLSAVVAMGPDEAVVAGSYGFVGVQNASTPKNELPGIEPPLTSMTLHGGFYTSKRQVIVGGTFDNPAAPKRGCVLYKGPPLPKLL